MLHRNVLFAGDPEQTRQTRPFSKYDSANPEDLWAHLAEYEARTGSGVIAIPHNSNLSRGRMFTEQTYDGAAITADYANLRAHREPVVEVTQIKGDSETRPLASPDDPFADFETWGGANFDKDDPTDAWVGSSYVRPALARGLGIEAAVGTNPFKFGLIGSSDSHNGLATADDDNFWGKFASNEPNPYRASSQWTYAASGYAGVWAEANTRQALFAAFKRREVYATTGPRIVLRFFGGWDYAEADAVRPDLAAVGYRRGVPMGGDLTRPDDGDAPRFLIRAVKDPDGANLDRLQVVKGWRTSDGGLFERVYDVAWSGDRSIVDRRARGRRVDGRSRHGGVPEQRRRPRAGRHLDRPRFRCRRSGVLLRSRPGDPDTALDGVRRRVLSDSGTARRRAGGDPGAGLLLADLVHPVGDGPRSLRRRNGTKCRCKDADSWGGGGWGQTARNERSGGVVPSRRLSCHESVSPIDRSVQRIGIHAKASTTAKC